MSRVVNPSSPSNRTSARVVVLTVIGALVVVGIEAGVAVGVRGLLDRRAYVSDLRLDAAMKTFRPAPHPGLAKPLEAEAFAADRNPRTDQVACVPLTALATGPAVDGRSWTGAGDDSPTPVTLLTVRFADAGAARAELDRKRRAMLRCHRVAVTFPPFDAPAVTYDVADQDWTSSAVGRRLRWTLGGGGQRFTFYVVRYGNTLTWTYDDNTVSSPHDREQVADDLVDELRDLAGR